MGWKIDGYKIIRKIGEGGTSVVFQAYDEEKQRYVAIKKIKHKNGMVASGGDVLLEEAKMLEGLNNTGIPRLYSREDDYIVMEHIPGNSLLTIIREKGNLTEKETVRIAGELIDILQYLHSRRIPVVYRDLKPSNLILKPDGHVALIDFGAAKLYKSGCSEDTTRLGTYGFAAPEQFGNLGQTDPKTDIYCFGMTLLQLLTGADIKDDEFISGFKRRGVKGCSAELQEIIYRCIKPDRDERFKSCFEVRKALDKYPLKKRLTTAKRIIGGVAAAALVAMVLSLSICFYEPAKSYAMQDADVRIPAVRQRLYNARVRIEAIYNDFVVEETE